MTANLLDGRALSQKMKGELAQEVQGFLAQHGYAPTLTVLLVGEDPASQSYVKAINKACSDAGIGCNQIVLPATTTEGQLKAQLRQFNEDPRTSGVIVQMPLPKPLTQDMVTDVLSPDKDVDGICPANAGLLALGQEGFVPNTPTAGWPCSRAMALTWWVRGPWWWAGATSSASPWLFSSSRSTAP